MTSAALHDNPCLAAASAAGRPTRILHVLDHSLPEQSGYASRSHSILLSLRSMGLQVEAITSPKHGATAAESDEIDAISYLRTASEGESRGVTSQLSTIRLTRRRLRDYLRQHDVALVHAHSPCLNGLAAASLGCPLVYEMRSSWEDAAVFSGTTSDGSLRYRLSRWLETAIARKADAVTVICDGLRRELISRGVPPDKITVVPNALPEAMFVPANADGVRNLRHRFGLEGKKVVGFFGSFFEWEGVDSLVRAMPVVLLSRPEAHLLLVGGGRQEAQLRDLVQRLGIGNAVTFAGRVAPDAILEFYGVADVMTYPRRPHRLTEMVTPLKPLEAMARNTPVIASDVGGHRELIRDGKTGILYPAGDEAELARRIVEVLGAGPAIQAIQQAGRRFVERERRWTSVSELYLPVYEGLLERQLVLSRSRTE